MTALLIGHARSCTDEQDLTVQQLEADIRAWIKDWNTPPETLHLDQERRRDPRITRTPIETNLWRRTLVRQL